jgi:hypothetical protein
LTFDAGNSTESEILPKEISFLRKTTITHKLRYKKEGKLIRFC